MFHLLANTRHTLPLPFAVFIVMGLLLILLGGCAPSRIVLQPATIQGDPQSEEKKSAGPQVDWTQPPETLFDAGYEAYAAGEQALALAYFSAILEHYPNAPQVPDSAYNAALVHQRQQNYEEAIELYRLVIKTTKRGKDVIDARFRILACLHELKRWQALLAELDELKDSYGLLSADDRVEIDTRRGVALYSMGEHERAEEQLKDAFQQYRIGLLRGDVYNEEYGAMAAYYLGLIQRQYFLDIELAAPDKQQLEQQLESKAQRLLDAQDLFLHSIEQDNAHWATASGYQIGLLYRDFYLAFKQAPLPPEIGSEADEIQMYRCMLQKQVQSLLRKSMKTYERTLEIGERLRVHNRWIERSREELSEIKQLYLDDIKTCENILPPDTP